MEKIEPQKQATEKILRKYHQLGHQETLKDWRANVPKEARRAWLCSFMQEKAGEDISEEHELFDEIIEKSLSKKKKKEYQMIKEKISRYKKESRDLEAIESDDNEDAIEATDDALSDAYFEMKYFLEGSVDTQMLSRYAQAYFLTFESDPVLLEKHFEKQDYIISQVIDYLHLLMENAGQELLKLHKQFPLTSLSEDISLYDITTNQLQPVENLCSSIIVCGSGAIGPRSSSPLKYPRKQDTDLLFIPKTQKNDWQADYQVLSAIIDYANLLQVEFKKPQDESPFHLPELPPSIKQLMDFFRQPGNNIDLHTPVLHSDGFMDDWRKLCGPHRVARQLSPTWEADYRLFLQKAIESSGQ